jgi:hypothetical protein
MFIPGVYVAVVTFPGVIVHELAHQLFCRWCGVAVFEVKYFQVANPVGYVLHEPPKKASHSILISTGPFLINSLLAFIIAFPAAIPVAQFSGGTFFDYLLLYLAISIGAHAFPSTTDASTMWNAVWHGENTPIWLKIILVPITGFILLGTLGSFFWLDLIYGVFLSILLPLWLAGML